MSGDDLLREIKSLINKVRGATLAETRRQKLAIELAQLMWQAAKYVETAKERRQQRLLARLMEDSKGRVFITQMTDQCFRSTDSSRVADQLCYLIREEGVPQFLPSYLRIQLMFFERLAPYIPKLCVPLLQYAIRKQASNVILSSDSKSLTNRLQYCYQNNLRVNLNYLGEAILGEAEAAHRLKIYLHALENPDVEYVSVKISTLFSQINLLAWEETLEHLAIPLRRLYKAAEHYPFQRANGHTVAKFVNLDMEEYRDLYLTVCLFKKVMSEPAFLKHSAGIVLQSYLPNSFVIQQQLTDWAKDRCDRGGVPVKLRLVKGANLAMEQVEASLRGWPQAPYYSKWETDANFKKMLHFACDTENAAAVHIGIGSHNLFDIAYALLLRSERQLENYISFEMLEGMAPALQRVIQAVTGDLLLYCPVVEQEQFQTAIAYLMRRLDENTAPANFLRACFDLNPDSEAWHEQVESFERACREIDNVSDESHRNQNRQDMQDQLSLGKPFTNVADTDWSIPDNRSWIQQHLQQIQQRVAEVIPLMLEGVAVETEHFSESYDPSRPGHLVCHYAKGDASHVERAVQAAHTAQKSWLQKTVSERSEALAKVALVLKQRRGELIAMMVAEGGKSVYEADGEVSEAIDFCEYYRRNVEELLFLKDIAWSPRGVVAVTPPWNFPCSIAVGGIAAALVTGNAVIYKPPSETVNIAWMVAQAFWEGGISKSLLQFLTGDDESLGTSLIQHPGIDVVLLTGATATARLFLKLRPGIALAAETGGKNSIIVTSLADRDQAIRSTIQSAFSHSGQKCSACSLLICLPEVYDDLHFRQQLRDAAASIFVDSAWNPQSIVTPLIRPASNGLLAALTTLDSGEEWLLEPQQKTANPNLWSPGIKLGVSVHSSTYKQELFGPVLAVMRAENLAHALELANGTPYGLTAGIHSLDAREQSYWLEHIEAGNCYVNRSITGAIVQRQPFGGYKASSFGIGAKAGGPNYLLQLMCAKQKLMPAERLTPNSLVLLLDKHVKASSLSIEEKQLWDASVGSYTFFWKRYFSQDHDPSALTGEDNILHYIPRSQSILRIQDDDKPLDVMRAIAAAYTVGSVLEISCEASFLEHPLLKGICKEVVGKVTFMVEGIEQLAQRLNGIDITGVRFLKPSSMDDAAVLAAVGIAIIHAPVLANGRLELIYYLKELAVSNSYHRYGYLGSHERQATAVLSTEGAGCCFGKSRPQGCCGSGECDQL
jgi:RHH-type proline utilization regulon transcriptional repressor/proline dehydrogenase/delta 1-pyrroline-5-carboxylate dehydrogenase